MMTAKQSDASSHSSDSARCFGKPLFKRMIAVLVKNRRNTQKLSLPLATTFGKAAVRFQAILRVCQLRRV